MTQQENCGFLFYTDGLSFDERQDFVVHIPPSIKDVNTLFEVFIDKLRLPGYFGFNWNALLDCLWDLSWIEQYRVVILHRDLPNLAKEDLSHYLDVLRESTKSWKPGEQHELVVAFPKSVETTVHNLLIDSN
jgi:RNAse (barnase) inhibitor barstar